MKCACAILDCHLWPVGPYNIFPRHLINCMIFEGGLLNVKCVIFSATFIWNISHSTKNLARHQKMYFGPQVKYPSFLSDFKGT